MLKGLGRDVTRNAKSDLRDAGNLMLSAVKGKVPIGTKPHKRYRKIGRRRAPKGFGVVEATYKPGNLKRSFMVLPLRRAKTAVFIGPALGKNRRVDGYYAHWVNNNTSNVNGKTRAGKKFVEAAFAAASPIVLRAIISSLTERVSNYIKTSGSFTFDKYASAKGR